MPRHDMIGIMIKRYTDENEGYSVSDESGKVIYSNDIYIRECLLMT